MLRVVRGKPALLRRPVNTEQEYPVEQIPELVLVPGDAAHEHRPVMPGQDRLHPGAAPYPAMRPEPLPVRECRAVHLMTSRVFPVRQARVVVGVNSQHAAAGQLPGKFRLPRSRIAGDKECGHKPSCQRGQAGLSGGQASGTTVFPSHSVIRPRRLGKRYPPLWSVLTASWRSVAKAQNRTVWALLLRVDAPVPGSPGSSPEVGHAVRPARASAVRPRSTVVAAAAASSWWSRRAETC